MNSSVGFFNSTSSRSLSRMPMKEVPRVLASAAVLGGLAVFIQALSQNPSAPKLTQMRKHLRIFIESTPVKLVMFILLGQTPLRYSGFLDRLSIADMVGVAGFGGVCLSVIYTLQERFKSTSLQSQGTFDDANGRSRHHHPREQVKLDWALQEKLTLLFICEIYHTIVGVVLGVFALRLVEVCYIDQKHLDLLMLSGLLGPIIFFALFVLTAGIIFGISWVVRSY